MTTLFKTLVSTLTTGFSLQFYAVKLRAFFSNLACLICPPLQ